jgi:hypothetical protein
MILYSTTLVSFTKKELKDIDKCSKRLASLVPNENTNARMMLRKRDDDSFRGLEDFTTKGQPLEGQLLYLAQDVVLEACFQNGDDYAAQAKTRV